VDLNISNTLLSSKKILCIGDIMLDQFIYGNVTRISPEAPVPVLLEKEQKEMLGGVGNLASNLSSLGANVAVIGIIGNDIRGEKVTELLKKYSIENNLIIKQDFQTITKIRVIAQNQHLLRLDIEKVQKIILLDDIKTKIENAIMSSDAVVISDYGKGFISNDISQFVIKVSNTNQKPIFVDPKGNDFSKYAGATFIKPNLNEFNLAIQNNINKNDSDFIDNISYQANLMVNKLNLHGLIVTLGEHGIFYFENKNNKITSIWKKSYAHEVYDVSGAGDTTLAAFVCAYICNNNAENSINFANTAAGIVVSKKGTATVSLDEIFNYSLIISNFKEKNNV
jgi:D-beta-D-heptose 7-phosphate kinase/D-beta-D-heptose 1-phosphate adenosyltransferase